jgi:hypothetical protein
VVGRPPLRTDRWYALLALIEITAVALRENDEELTRLRRERRLPQPARETTSQAVRLQPQSITNALTTATRRGLFQRRIPGSTMSIPRPKTTPRGFLTEEGWAALGQTVRRDDFDEAWRRTASPEDLRAAISYLAEELDAEYGSVSLDDAS